MKNQNVDRGLSLFEAFGAPVDKDISDLFRGSKADEVNCSIEIDENSVKSISIQILQSDLCENMTTAVDSNYNSIKWNAYHSLVPSKFIALELNSEGFLLKKISIL